MTILEKSPIQHSPLPCQAHTLPRHHQVPAEQDSWSGDIESLVTSGPGKVLSRVLEVEFVGLDDLGNLSDSFFKKLGSSSLSHCHDPLLFLQIIH